MAKCQDQTSYLNDCETCSNKVKVRSSKVDNVRQQGWYLYSFFRCNLYLRRTLCAVEVLLALALRAKPLSCFFLKMGKPHKPCGAWHGHVPSFGMNALLLARTMKIASTKHVVFLQKIFNQIYHSINLGKTKVDR